MADECSLTPCAVTLVGAESHKQALSQALEVLDYDEGEFLAGVVGLTGTSPSATVEIITGMQTESEDGWQQAAVFTAMNSPNMWEKKTVKGLLKYIRWKVTVGGTSPTATFVLSGVLRRWS